MPRVSCEQDPVERSKITVQNNTRFIRRACFTPIFESLVLPCFLYPFFGLQDGLIRYLGKESRGLSDPKPGCLISDPTQPLSRAAPR